MTLREDGCLQSAVLCVCWPITGSLSIIVRQSSLYQVIVNSEKFLWGFESQQELSAQSDIHQTQIALLYQRG